jgi:flagellar basal body L-ring protein FlgH
VTDRRFAKSLRLGLALLVVGSLAGCDTLSGMNPFAEKKTPLPGERRPVPKVAPEPPNTVPQPLTALPQDGARNLA